MLKTLLYVVRLGIPAVSMGSRARGPALIKRYAHICEVGIFTSPRTLIVDNANVPPQAVAR